MDEQALLAKRLYMRNYMRKWRSRSESKQKSREYAERYWQNRALEVRSLSALEAELESLKRKVAD